MSKFGFLSGDTIIPIEESKRGLKLSSLRQAIWESGIPQVWVYVPEYDDCFFITDIRSNVIILTNDQNAALKPSSLLTKILERISDGGDDEVRFIFSGWEYPNDEYMLKRTDLTSDYNGLPLLELTLMEKLDE